MAGFCDDEYGCLGTLDIVGDVTFPMNCPAWDLTDLQKLWVEYAIRTDSVTLPTAPGQRSYPGRLDQGEYDLTLFVTGRADQDGVANSDEWMGLYDNLQTLWAEAISPVGTGRGTRAAVLTLPDGATTLTADVKFTPLRAVSDVDNAGLTVYRTTLIVPAGRFE